MLASKICLCRHIGLNSTLQILHEGLVCFWAGKFGKVVPTFLGYLVHEGATLLADGFVRNTQLPVVLDLDETLLVANSFSQLESQMAKAKESRYRPIYKPA